jgi:hypothetical protein
MPTPLPTDALPKPPMNDEMGMPPAEGADDLPPMNDMPGEEAVDQGLVDRSPPAPEGADPSTHSDVPLDAPPEEEGGAGEPEGKAAITGKYNSSPVGDVKMNKAKNTYNTYKLELSMGQLEVIMTALERNHADAVSDELLATIKYYIEKLPGPGEEEEEAEARNQAAKGQVGDENMPLPMPPGGGQGDEASLPLPEVPGGQPGEPPGKAKMLQHSRAEGGGGAGGQPGSGPPGGAQVGLPEPEDMGGGAGVDDRSLPRPPRE